MNIQKYQLKFKVPSAKEPLEGAPFNLVYHHRFLPRIRKLYYLVLFYWVYMILSKSLNENLRFQSYIGILLLLLSLTVIQDKAIQISGNHANWQINKYRYNEIFAVRYFSINIKDLFIEFRLVMSDKYKLSKIIIYDGSFKITDFMFTKKQAKELQNYCEIINIPVKIRRKGYGIGGENNF